MYILTHWNMNQELWSFSNHDRCDVLGEKLEGQTEWKPTILFYGNSPTKYLLCFNKGYQDLRLFRCQFKDRLSLRLFPQGGPSIHPERVQECTIFSVLSRPWKEYSRDLSDDSRDESTVLVGGFRGRGLW